MLMAKPDNIFLRTSNKLEGWLDYLSDTYGIFGVAAFLMGGTAAVIAGLGLIVGVCLWLN